MTQESAFGIVAHGGAGTWREDKQSRALKGLRRAIRRGYDRLEDGESSLAAVEEVVTHLEDNPNFNAGTGASLNVDGDAEMDASIMRGRDRNLGAVASLTGVKNPVQVARDVMEQTDHVMLVGPGAQRFARALGYPDYDPVTDATRESFRKKKKGLTSGEKTYSFPRLVELLEEYPELSHGTVGAAALDREGNLASATSTGGLIMKLAGRVGDTPLPGAGTYATRFCAASATGQGEQVMRTLGTKHLCDRVESGSPAARAVRETLEYMGEHTDGEAGLIAIDREGVVGAAHHTAHMPHAWRTSDMEAEDAQLVESPPLNGR